MEVKIYYEDTDCGKVVYYANYLKYFERARTEYMEERGIDFKTLHQQGTFFMVASAKINYRSPAYYGETLIVDTWISQITRVSFTFQYKVFEKSSKRLVAEGETVIVTVDSFQKLKRLDAQIMAKLQTNIKS